MSDKKLTIDDIEVPEEMIEAARITYESYGQGSYCVDSIYAKSIHRMIAAALLYLANHPIVPTKEESDEMYQRLHARRSFRWNDIQDAIAEWQLRMFLKREPELPEEVKRYRSSLTAVGHTKEEAETIIRAIYELGKKADAR